MSMTGELIKVEDQLDEYFVELQDAETDEQQTQLQLVLTQAIQEHATRVDSVVSWFQRGDAEIDFLKAEKQRIADLIEHWEKKQKTVRQILAAHMDTHNIKKLPGRVHNITFRKGALGVEILDEAAIPEQFKLQVITYKVDKKAVKAALESFEEVPGAALVEGTPTVVVK